MRESFIQKTEDRPTPFPLQDRHTSSPVLGPQTEEEFENQLGQKCDENGEKDQINITMTNDKQNHI